MLRWNTMRFVTSSVLAILLLTGSTPPPPAPRLILWAWEWPQDLRFLEGEDVGVAYLAATVRVHRNGVQTIPRRQPLRIPKSLYTIAVVRVEVDKDRGEPLDAGARAEIANTFRLAARSVRAVQIDFDARASQRPGYRQLLLDIRNALPPRTFLSMTALASWCSFDDWLGEVTGSVDEIVPMLFSMGPEGQAIWRQVVADGELRSVHCRSSVGVATYEAHPPVPREHRLFVFHKGPWDRETFDRVVQRETRP